MIRRSDDTHVSGNFFKKNCKTTISKNDQHPGEKSDVLNAIKRV